MDHYAVPQNLEYYINGEIKYIETKKKQFVIKKDLNYFESNF